MQQLLILSLWIFALLYLFRSGKRQNLLLSICVSWWCFWFLISSFSLSGLFPPGWFLQSILSLFIIGIVFGHSQGKNVIVKSFLHLGRNKEHWELPGNRLFSIISLGVLLPLIYLAIRTTYLLSTKFDSGTYRAEVFGLITGSSELFHNSSFLGALYWHLLHPILWAYLFTGLVEAFYFNRWTILIFGCFCFALDSIITVGRFGLYYAIVSLFVVLILRSCFRKKEGFGLGEFTFLGIGILLFLFGMFSIRSFSSFSDTVKHYVLIYHTCAFSILDVEFRNPNSLLFEISLGKSFFGGLLNLPNLILGKFANFHFINEADRLGSYLHQYFLVGFDKEANKPIYHNAFGSIFFSMYRDGRLLGIFLFGSAFGYLMAIGSSALMRKNRVHLTILLGCFYILIFGLFQPITSGAILPGLLLAVLNYTFFVPCQRAKE